MIILEYILSYLFFYIVCLFPLYYNSKEIDLSKRKGLVFTGSYTVVYILICKYLVK